MQNLKDAIKKATGYEVKYIFSDNLSPGGFVDYGTGGKTYAVGVNELEIKGGRYHEST